MAQSGSMAVGLDRPAQHRRLAGLLPADQPQPVGLVLRPDPDRRRARRARARARVRGSPRAAPACAAPASARIRTERSARARAAATARASSSEESTPRRQPGDRVADAGPRGAAGTAGPRARRAHRSARPAGSRPPDAPRSAPAHRRRSRDRSAAATRISVKNSGRCCTRSPPSSSRPTQLRAQPGLRPGRTRVRRLRGVLHARRTRGASSGRTAPASGRASTCTDGGPPPALAIWFSTASIDLVAGGPREAAQRAHEGVALLQPDDAVASAAEAGGPRQPRQSG